MLGRTNGIGIDRYIDDWDMPCYDVFECMVMKVHSKGQCVVCCYYGSPWTLISVGLPIWVFLVVSCFVMATYTPFEFMYFYLFALVCYGYLFGE